MSRSVSPYFGVSIPAITLYLRSSSKRRLFEPRTDTGREHFSYVHTQSGLSQVFKLILPSRHIAFHLPPSFALQFPQKLNLVYPRFLHITVCNLFTVAIFTIIDLLKLNFRVSLVNLSSGIFVFTVYPSLRRNREFSFPAA